MRLSQLNINCNAGDPKEVDGEEHLGLEDMLKENCQSMLVIVFTSVSGITLATTTNYPLQAMVLLVVALLVLQQQAEVN